MEQKIRILVEKVASLFLLKQISSLKPRVGFNM